MSLALGQQLTIRAMVYVAGEPVSFFWPMRTFIHHNPLHGLENQSFFNAIKNGKRLFGGRGFLPRHLYQQYLAQGKISVDDLQAKIGHYAAQMPAIPGMDLPGWLMALLTGLREPVSMPARLAEANDVQAALTGDDNYAWASAGDEELIRCLNATLLEDQPIYESIDTLYGTDIGSQLDDLVVKSCLDFFDEGQSVWDMPERERGFFSAWRQVALRNARLFLRGLRIREILQQDDSPEGIISYVMENLQVPQQHWSGYFSREFARLHGWSGFIRWRANAKDYAWSQRYPADLVDYLAVRLTLALALIRSCNIRRVPVTTTVLRERIEARPHEFFLRYELATGQVVPRLAHDVEKVLARARPKKISAFCSDYSRQKRAAEAQQQANRLLQLAQQVEQRRGNNSEAEARLRALSASQLQTLQSCLQNFEEQEGMIWLEALEKQATHRLLERINLQAEAKRDKRPFAQALFCIDVRSERIRRHLEAIGDYQTYGIAGFFGVPASFIEYGKGSETHLCPVLLTPKNLVLEITGTVAQDEATLSALGKAVHELKESVLTPFVTVEAIGLLFGFDMFGKTLLPVAYSKWRSHLDKPRPQTRLLIDKLDREQADSIVRAVQRALVLKAVEQELGIPADLVTDDIVRDLRQRALGRPHDNLDLEQELGIDKPRLEELLERLKNVYLVNRAFARMQMEQLGRIGFTIAEQTNFVSQALRSIGLTSNFSRFVLLVGHGSKSDNNPYESALDCGACGGNHGLVNARILAQMANKPEVRQRLQAQGIHIENDAHFIPALHNTTTDEIKLYDLELIPPSHFIYIDRLKNGLAGASQRTARERLQTLQPIAESASLARTQRMAIRNSVDWSQVRPEWGLSRNLYFVIGRRNLTRELSLEGRAFLHSYDYRLDPNLRLLENILSGPLVVGQWINMEHYFSTVDNQHYGSGSKVYHNVAGRFGVMTGNLSDLRTGLPAQTVLKEGLPYHEPLRLIAVIEAPLQNARQAVESVAAVKRLVLNGWIRIVIIDPEQTEVTVYEDRQWQTRPLQDGLRASGIQTNQGVVAS